MKIKIGADELILWLRKNKIAVGIPNDGVQGLGAEIYRIIKGLGGDKIKSLVNDPVYWAVPVRDFTPTNGNNYHTDQIDLPQTSTQYEIDIENVSKVYEKLLDKYDSNTFASLNPQKQSK